MKQFVNHYSYKKYYDEVTDENGKHHYVNHNSFLYAEHKNRNYATKMTVKDLPEYYCDVFRIGEQNDVISSKDVVDIHYDWVKENHFMKDSILYISYTGKLEPYHEKFMYDGREIVSFFISYTNEDDLIFGNDILKFLAYLKKYSKCDISETRKKFIEQCEWLKENEPFFTPDLENFKDYGEWFDNKTKFENYDNKGIDK